jgi:zinc transporter ZupT
MFTSIMETSLLQLLIFGLIAASANVFGGLILFPSKIHKDYKQYLKYLLALGAGFMLSVTFFEIIPKTVLIWQKSYPASSEDLYQPMLLLMAGYLLTQFFEHTIAPHFHLGEEIHAESLISKSSAYTAVGGLMIHTFFDGVSIAAASQIDVKVGFLVFIAVFLHKFPEGFTIGSMIMAAGKGLREVIWSTALLGGTTLLGVLIFYVIGTNLGITVAYALPLASGVTLYVAASDLIPEVNHHGGNRPMVSISVFAGVALFFLLHYALHQFLEQ